MIFIQDGIVFLQDVIAVWQPEKDLPPGFPVHPGDVPIAYASRKVVKVIQRKVEEPVKRKKKDLTAGPFETIMDPMTKTPVILCGGRRVPDVDVRTPEEASAVCRMMNGFEPG